MALVALGFIRLVDLIGVKNQAMFLFETDTWFSDFIFPGRFILWFVSMISHPEPDVFFVDPKLWQFSWGCLRPAILPAMFVGLAQSQRTMKTSSQLLKGCVIYMYTI